MEKLGNFDKMLRFLFACLVSFGIVSCAPSGNASRNSTPLTFLGSYSIPLNSKFQNTTVGGLSGIDYDPVKQLYYLISDDGSKIDPARFYTARINTSEQGIDTVQLLSVTTLLSQEQQPYTFNAVDPEAIRYHAPSGHLFWSSEGRRNPGAVEKLSIQPSIKVVSKEGLLVDSLPLPANLLFAENRGPRHNESLEGLAFDPAFRHLFISLESPLYEDGNLPGTGDSTAFVRLIRYDLLRRQATAQYAYELDPVARPSLPGNAFRVNGISEILWWSNHQLLVVERSFSTGHKGCVVKVFLADLDSADPIPADMNLGAKPWKPLKKKLLVNMQALGIPVYNIEGVTEGPRLPGGQRTLLFVADDNFSPNDQTQFLLFKVSERLKF